MEPGVYKMGFDEYKAIDALNNSTLVAMKKTPAHALIEKEPTAAMLFGSAFDCFLLEPHWFALNYAVVPLDMKLTTKEGKAWAKENERKQIIKREDFDTFLKMDNSLHSGQYELARNLVERGEPQFSLVWTHPKFDIPCKARPDLMAKDMNLIADIKTTTNAEPSAWFRTMLNAGILPHYQAAWYLEGANQTSEIEFKPHNEMISEIIWPPYTDFLWILFETKPPHGISVIGASKEMLYLAQEEIKMLIPEYIEYRRKGHWPCYPDKIVEVQIPKWYYSTVNI